MLEVRIEDIFDENGLEYDDGVLTTVMDSIQYLSTLVAIESEFGIEFPDEYLTNDILTNQEHLLSIINSLIENNNKNFNK